MSEYLLSEKADQDLVEIYLFSYHRFGEARADAYLLALEERFETLAGQPGIGRRIDHIREGYYRYNHASHAIFYTLHEKGILIVRVLHGHMNVEERL